ncbi:MAG: ABC transporter ATP-binding protein [Peptococcaceae bacterium]|nr:ABC transporter ATP-binding protein [Peptococcaceae bacterium]
MTCKTGDTVVLARGLIKRFGDFEAVRGINFEVRGGECFGLLGPNGAGKTSVVRMIYGFSPVTSGRLEVFGEDIGVKARSVKARIGVVSQEDNLDPELSVMENLLVYAGYFRINRDLAGERSREILEFMDLADKAGHVVESLSGGQKRRLTIGRALINRPDLMLLDEPTTGLDPYARHLVWQRLRKLKESGTTMILTTHYLEEASQLCDRLVIMNRGEVLEEGSPEELISRHVGREALELGSGAGLDQYLLEGMGELVKASRVLGEDLVIFTERGRELDRRISERAAELGIEIRRRGIRPANLEDVFLKLTGETLKGGREFTGGGSCD